MISGTILGQNASVDRGTEIQVGTTNDLGIGREYLRTDFGTIQLCDKV